MVEDRRLAGMLDPSQIWALSALTVARYVRSSRTAADYPYRRDRVAILPLIGIISQHGGYSGTSIDEFARHLRSALRDDYVKAVVIEVHSPGGRLYGVDELAAEIYAARGIKPIVAIANSLMASAAYWIASAADEVVATFGASVGGLGIVAMHTDRSARYAQQGIKPTLISAGMYKTEGNQFEALTDAARLHMQSRVDGYELLMMDRIARGRGTTPTRVKLRYGQGRLMGAQEAFKAGMVDRIEGLDSTVARLSR